MMPRLLLALLVLMATRVLVAPAKEFVREQSGFIVNGSKEVWRLIWRGTPNESNTCGPVNPEMAMTCPCSGAAYAQVGDLMLERQRRSAPPERMPLTPLFAGSDMVSSERGTVAMLPRWPTHLRDIDSNPLPAAIRGRPAVTIMRLRDYNHDGIAGEFLVQVDTRPCGKHVLVAVGTTRGNARLHVLTSAEHPERPLALYQWQWDALVHSPRPRKVMDRPCGDHGAQKETTMVLKADGGRLHATRITSTCRDTLDANGGAAHDAHFVKKLLKREIM